ncbi:AraC family transcriptional regulator (plasmid) [Niallia taxi]|uniref:AraC family transcriptional regulator n=1 Tax=Niallia taxi TaxID=2499688 RepID=UPI002934F3E7|nr:AraC family transcriptional regulator [Niallia taxi]WOD65194.1 AraC family transcriptional regulator [Niallia taxi]
MFKILRMGCNSTHGNNFSVNRPKGYEWCLLLFVKSPAVFIINGEAVSTPANTLIIFDKNYPHEYRSSGAEYKNDWIHFELNASFFDQYPINLNTPLFISNHLYISDLIQKIANEFYSINSYKEQTIDYLMRVLFVKTKEMVETNTLQPWRSKVHEELIKLRSEIYSNPQHNWSIALMASKLHISCGHLQNIYKNTFHISCMSDVIKSRITYAKELLMESDSQVGEISNLCGYENEVHFMRQFKKLTTLTPSEYRRLNSIRDK